MIEKITLIDQILVTETNAVQVRKVTRIMEDGEKLSETYHRWVLQPRDDISEEDVRVQAICNAAWK